jgi:poly(A) polymerase
MADFNDPLDPPGSSDSPLSSDEPARPVVLTKPGHPISRHGIDPDALRIMSRLQRMGFIAYLCGGAVRDLLLGKKPKDYDIATDARPGQIKKRFANVFVIGRRFRLAHVHFPGGKIIEVATFRRDPDPAAAEEADPNAPSATSATSATTRPSLAAESTGSSATTGLPDPQAIYGTPREDAFRRDITINALYYDPSIDAVIDYVGGLEDMRCFRVRTIGDPGVRFTEDPVRVWRVLRHAARLGFEIEGATARAVQSHRHLLASVAGSRLYEEFNKDLAYETRPVFAALRECGLLRHFLGKAGEDYETDDALFARIVALLDIEEKARRSGFLLTPEEMYALIFWPWVEPRFGETEEDMAEVLNAAFLNAGIKMTIPKSLRANFIQILVLVEGLIRALRTGHLRGALLQKSHYGQAVRLFFLIEKGRPPAAGESFEALFGEAHPEAESVPRLKRRRRRRRGRRGGANGSGGAPGGNPAPNS